MRTSLPLRKTARYERISRAGKRIRSSCNIEEATGEYVVYVAVPGMERKDFSVRISGQSLQVSAAKKEALHCFQGTEKQIHPRWTQSFSLPADADTVMTAAVYRNGELEIHIPRGKSATTGMPFDIYVY